MDSVADLLSVRSDVEDCVGVKRENVKLADSLLRSSENE
jgi:hypothetical protein